MSAHSVPIDENAVLVNQVPTALLYQVVESSLSNYHENVKANQCDLVKLVQILAYQMDSEMIDCHAVDVFYSWTQLILFHWLDQYARSFLFLVHLVIEEL